MYQEKVNNRQAIEVKLQKGTYCYYNIAEKWNWLLCEPEIADWGAPLIVRLLDKVETLKDKDNTIAIYETPEWLELVSRIGPAEAAWEQTCLDCGQVNIGFGSSGFVNEFYIVDYDLKTITWKSCYSKDPYPNYDLCGKCGGRLSLKKEISPYKATKEYKIIRT